MKRSPHGRLVGLTAGALLAILASGTVLPSSARAGCNSFAAMALHSSPQDADGLELLRLAASSVPRDDASDHRSAPCTGALCSGNPAPPLTAEPPVPPPTGGEWALSPADRSSTGPGSFLSTNDGARLEAVNRPGSIFHPPRPSRPAR
jgi:hypothetical protein